MNGAHLPHVDVSKIIQDRPALQCHAVSAVFGMLEQKDAMPRGRSWQAKHPNGIRKVENYGLATALGRVYMY